MKMLVKIFAVAIICLLGSCVEDTKEAKLEKKMRPSDHFFMQRTYPDGKFALEAYEKAITRAQTDHLAMRAAASNQRANNTKWETEGPGNIGGRFNTLAYDGVNGHIYAGSAAGGVFKTTDNGATWLPIFDEQAFLAIGDIEIDPNDPSTVYVGTGDPNISGYPFIGDGVYKSTDAGASWTSLGLTDQRIVSKIAVHPQNSDLIYTATMGLPFERNNERGLYKSTNGGQSWQQVLFLSDSAGIIDLMLHPTDTNIVYASGWNRIRNNQESLLTGAESQIYKSIDAGATWTPIMNGIVAPFGGFHSRINLDMSGTDPNVIFASVVDSSYELGGIYKSTNAGASWVSLSMNGLPPEVLGGFGWYFGQIKVDPADDDNLFILGVELHGTTDGGNFWDPATPPWWQYEVHADMHDLIFEGNDLYLATDGGLYSADKFALTWSDIENIPVTQFYHVAIRDIEPGVYYGGAQDNGTTGGNSSIINSWPRIFGGDGFDIQFHPTNANIFYATTQNGGLVVTDDNGNSFFDATDGIDTDDRRNWDAPFKISYHDPSLLFAGTYRLYKSVGSTNPFWTATSNDLTDGVIFGDNFHTISVIEDSKIDANTLFVGTSDGNVWRSTDLGGNWINITGTLPNRYVTDLETSVNTPEFMVSTHSGYKDNDFIPHVHASLDNGTTWVDISGDLPTLAVSDVEISSVNDSVLFVATDGGVYYTTNMGTNWQRLGSNMPVITVYDIEIDEANRKLVAGTFSRSIMSIGIDSITSQVSGPLLAVNITGEETICDGNSAILTANSNGAGLQYSWTPNVDLSCSTCASPLASPSISTTYYVEVSNGGLSQPVTDSFMVNVVPGLNDLNIASVGDSVFVDTTTGATYQWQLDGADIQGATASYYIVTENGLYTAIVSNGTCIELQSKQVVLSGIASEAFSYKIKVFPNPIETSFTLQLPSSSSGEWQATILDINGRTIYATTLKEGITERSIILNARAGLYLLQLEDNSGNIALKQLIKN